MHIGVTGIIGAGKSTLIRRLSDSYEYEPFYEPVDDNPYLEDFYCQPERFSALMQLHILGEKFDQHETIREQASTSDVLQDCPMHGDFVFARVQHQSGFMDDRDFATYKQHYENYHSLFGYPDLFLYLDVTPEEALSRISQRGRDGEGAIDRSYLKHLKREYERMLSQAAEHTHVIRLGWNEFHEPQVVEAVLPSRVPTENTIEQIEP